MIALSHPQLPADSDAGPGGVTASVHLCGYSTIEPVMMTVPVMAFLTARECP